MTLLPGETVKNYTITNEVLQNQWHRRKVISGPCISISFTVQGREVYREQTRDDVIDLNLRIAAGTYYVRLECGEAVSVQPLVIRN